MIQPSKPSRQAQMLYEALVKRGITCEPEYFDGHKHVDIAVLSARMFIEVDGLNHFVVAEQIIRDFKRSHYSDGDDISTFYVTNQIIDKYLDRVVEALIKVIESRLNK
jgi:very-short-patch-repair endonuclease